MSKRECYCPIVNCPQDSYYMCWKCREHLAAMDGTPPSAPSPSDTSYPQPARLETGAANAALDRVGAWVRRLADWVVRR